MIVDKVSLEINLWSNFIFLLDQFNEPEKNSIKQKRNFFYWQTKWNLSIQNGRWKMFIFWALLKEKINSEAPEFIANVVL